MPLGELCEAEEDLFERRKVGRGVAAHPFEQRESPNAADHLAGFVGRERRHAEPDVAEHLDVLAAQAEHQEGPERGLGGDAEENAKIVRGILSGEIQGPKRNAVLLNAAAALSTECGDLAAGLEEARASLDSGAALRVLEAFVAKTQSFVK